MLINGKEVNHLFLNGEQFDLSNFGKKIKIVKRIEVGENNVRMDGKFYYYNHGGAGVISAGTMGYVIGLTYGECYYIFDTTIKNPVGTWVPKDSVEMLESGGVNSPSCLLLLYNVREVAPSC